LIVVCHDAKIKNRFDKRGGFGEIMGLRLVIVCEMKRNAFESDSCKGFD
jgi:hypothetical protein